MEVWLWKWSDCLQCVKLSGLVDVSWVRQGLRLIPPPLFYYLLFFLFLFLSPFPPPLFRHKDFWDGEVTAYIYIFITLLFRLSRRWSQVLQGCPYGRRRRRRKRRRRRGRRREKKGKKEAAEKCSRMTCLHKITPNLPSVCSRCCVICCTFTSHTASHILRTTEPLEFPFALQGLLPLLSLKHWK